VDGAQFQLLDKIIILGASSLYPNITEDIGNYTACSLGIKLEPEEMLINYDTKRDTIEITTTNRKTFA